MSVPSGTFEYHTAEISALAGVNFGVGFPSRVGAFSALGRTRLSATSAFVPIAKPATRDAVRQSAIMTEMILFILFHLMESYDFAATVSNSQIRKDCEPFTNLFYHIISVVSTIFGWSLFTKFQAKFVSFGGIVLFC